MRLRHLVIVVFVCIGPGCLPPISSLGVASDDMSARFEVTVSEGGCGGRTARIVAHLDASTPQGTTSVKLDDGDELKAKYQKETESFSMTELLGSVSYKTDIEIGKDKATEILVTLKRADRSDATASLWLATDLSLKLAQSGDEFSRSKDDLLVIVEGDPADANEETSWSATGSCVNSLSGDITNENRSILIQKGDLVPPLGGKKECDLTITVRRTRTGKVGSFAESSSFTSTVERTLELESVP